MKYSECKPCEFFATKPSGKRKSICSLHEEIEESKNVSIKKIIWCLEFENRNKKDEDKR